MTERTLRIALALAFLLPAATATAQREGYSYLSYVGSGVTLVSSAEDNSSARMNTPILVGDRIATGPTSRAEAILADGNVLRVDVQTSLRLDRLAKTYEAEDDRNALYLDRGAVSLEHRWSSSDEQATRIDTDDVTVLFPDKGLVRVETGRRGTEVYVVSGRAEVSARSGRSTLQAGQYAFVSGDAEVEVDWLDEPRDRFTRFVAERRNLTGEGSGASHVSADYDYDYAAGGLEQNGSWVALTGTGDYGWRPTVSADWRPYVDGYWRWSPAGMTWVSYESWGWLPYHYGSWLWDTGYGWCWTPGVRYSPAWVYWNYTPSWVGWCPIGYYGGYYDSYNRSYRSRRGAERWTNAYPHLRGRVDLTRIDPRGWSWASTSRIGTRFDARRDVLGSSRVGFRPGERGLVATTPLRIDRGSGSMTTAIQTAVRRVPQTLGSEPRRGAGLTDLTNVMRRDGTLPTAAREELRRSFVTPGKDPDYRPVSADQLAAPHRNATDGTRATLPSRPGRSGFTSDNAPVRGLESTAAGSPPRESWRNGGGAAEVRPDRTANTAPRRDAGPRLDGGFSRDRSVRSDDGWRSPGSETRSGTSRSRTADAPTRYSAPAPQGPNSPRRSGQRETAPNPEPWRSASGSRSAYEPPARSETGTRTGSSGRREAPGLRGDEGWRGANTPTRSNNAPPSRSWDSSPRSAPAPRSEAPSRSYSAPPSRSWDSSPRSAPAPRSEAPSRSYDAPPSRSYSAPPSRSWDSSPRSVPAPRSEAPSRSYSGSSSRSSAPPASRSGSAPRRGSSPRG